MISIDTGLTRPYPVTQWSVNPPPHMADHYTVCVPAACIDMIEVDWSWLCKLLSPVNRIIGCYGEQSRVREKLSAANGFERATVISCKISCPWAPYQQNLCNGWAQKWGPICNPDIYNSTIYHTVIYSVLPIYHGRVYRGIGYIAVAYWTPFFGAQERDIFLEIAVTPLAHFGGDNFLRNLLTAIAFCSRSQETIFREINWSLTVNAGWNTCCAMVGHARRSIDTSIVSQSRVQLIHCQCKSWIQIANLGVDNAF